MLIKKNNKMEDIIQKYPNELNSIQSEVLYKEGYEYLINKWNNLCSYYELEVNIKELIMKSCELYLKKMKNMGFINNNNIKYVFELLEKNITGFSTKFINDYAAWNEEDGCIRYNKNNNFSEERAIRTIFHELNHALINRRVNGKNPCVEVKQIDNNLRHAKIIANNKQNVKIPGLQINGILNEYLAEEIAQQLWYEDDKKRPAKTAALPFGIRFGKQIYSNLEPGYNRAYQQITEEFLKNIRGINTKDNNTNEKRARSLFNFCLMKGDNNILVDLFNQYNSSNIEHKRKIFRTLGNISSKICYKSNIIPDVYCYSDSEIFNLLQRDCINFEHNEENIRRDNSIEER